MMSSSQGIAAAESHDNVVCSAASSAVALRYLNPRAVLLRSRSSSSSASSAAALVVGILGAVLLLAAEPGEAAGAVVCPRVTLNNARLARNCTKAQMCTACVQELSAQLVPQAQAAVAANPALLNLSEVRALHLLWSLARGGEEK